MSSIQEQNAAQADSGGSGPTGGQVLDFAGGALDSFFGWLPFPDAAPATTGGGGGGSRSYDEPALGVAPTSLVLGGVVAALLFAMVLSR